VEDELVALLQRQREALELLESRLRALELLVAADEQRFVAAALDELEDASERLAALELGRVLVLGSAGYGPDLAAEELVREVADADVAARFVAVVDGMRLAVARVGIARERALAVIRPDAEQVRARLEAASAYAGV
jgi:hypothetical protein